jgi:hypothetical protein
MTGLEIKGKKGDQVLLYASRNVWMGIETTHENKGRRNWQG